jgi:hypothetical protein
MIARPIILLSIVIISISCTRQVKQDQPAISGQFLNASGKTITLNELTPDSVRKLDSVILDQTGKFRFAFTPQTAGFYLVKANTGENILLLAEKDEKITVSTDFKKEPFDYQVTGSPGSLLLKDFYTKTFVNLSKADSVAAILRKMQGSPDFYKQSVILEPVFMKIINDQKELERSFIRSNMKSLASLIILNYKFGMMPVLTIGDDFDLYAKLDSSLSIAYPSNKHVNLLHNIVVQYKEEQQQPGTVQPGILKK